MRGILCLVVFINCNLISTFFVPTIFQHKSKILFGGIEDEYLEWEMEERRLQLDELKEKAVE